MDFSPSKPSHWGVLLLLTVSLFVFIGFPILSYIGAITYTSGGESGVINDVILLIIQLILVFLFFILVPILWFKVINGYSLPQIYSTIGLTRENLDLTIVWGIITAICAFTVVFAISIILSLLGVDVSKASNIGELKQFFSIPTLFILIVVQPFAEEIFFRGFLLVKLSSILGITAGIILSSILFGLAHLSYGNIYPAAMTALVGVVLAVSVVRTKNLYTSIIAHTLFNVTSFSLYILAELLRGGSLTL